MAEGSTIIGDVPSFLVVVVTSFLAIALIRALMFGKGGKKRRLPPSPPALPLIGHLTYLRGTPLHQNLTRLARKYGKVLLLRIGSRPLLVINSASAAEDCLVGNDIVFANRPKNLVSKILGFNYSSLGFVPYGPLWRNLRRTVAMEILSTPRLNQLSHVRTEEVLLFAKELAAAGRPGKFTTANMRRKFTTVTFYVMMRLLIGVRPEKSDPKTVQFLENFKRTVALSLSLFPGDSIPILKLLDFGRFERSLITVREDGNAFLKSIVEDRKKSVKLLTKEELQNPDMGINCLVDSLLSRRAIDPDYYTEDYIYGALSFMLVAGTDASAVTSEWGLALLANHPQVLERVREEVESQTGKGNLVTEQDASNLPYLQAVVWEILRMYPPLPLLIPHESSADSVVDGYDVPAGTVVFINIPGIQRDPELWEEPDKFKPERFLNNPELASKSGAGGKYLPFGAGRRRCPGDNLGMRNARLILATLVQCFDWESVDGKALDMQYDGDLTMFKKVPLELKYRLRDCMIDALA